jgi:zinc protease
VVLLDEIRALDDNPSGLAFRAMGRALYPCHPYRMHLLGTAEVVSRLGRRDLERFYRRHYPVSRLVLAIVGDVDPDRARERIGRLLGAGKAPPRAQPEPRPDPPLAGPVLIEALREKRQAHLVLGFRGATLDSPDRYPLEVLSTILSGQGGRLFQQLRDRQSLAYSVSSVSLEGLEPGYFAVYIGTSPEKIGEALLSIQRQLCLIQESRVPATELRRAQRYLVGTHAISLQRLAAQAGLISLDECYGLGYDASSRYPAHIMRVTRDNVLEVARRYLDLKRYALSIVRPADATDFASLDLVAGARRME